MYAYALFCDRPGCTQRIYIPAASSTPGPAFQMVHTYARQSGWAITPEEQHYCPTHVPTRFSTTTYL